MNYEEIREKYNEVMYDERDMIETFLKSVNNNVLGKGEWELTSVPQLELLIGSKVGIHCISLDRDKFVLFHGDNYETYECFNFQYGELEKIISLLPDADELNRQNAYNNLKEVARECSIVFEDDEKFTWTDGNIKYTIRDIVDDGRLSFDVSVKDKAESFGIWEDLPNDVVIKFAEHTKKVVLHRSKEYNKLMELLALEENLCFNFAEKDMTRYATFKLEGADFKFIVLDVSRDDSGNLTIYGDACNDEKLIENVTLTEKDIKPEYLKEIIETIEASKKSNLEERIALTDEQKAAVAEFEESFKKLEEMNVGIIMDDDKRLYAINKEHVNEFQSSYYINEDIDKDLFVGIDFKEAPICDKFLSYYLYNDESLYAWFK